MINKNSDSKFLQQLEIISKGIGDFLRTLLEYSIDNELKPIQFKDLDYIDGKFNFKLSDDLMFSDDEINYILLRSSELAIKHIKKYGNELGVSECNIEFLKLINNTYDWKDTFNGLISI